MERIVVWGVFGVIASFLFMLKSGTTKELIGGAIAGGLAGAFVGLIFELVKGEKES